MKAVIVDGIGGGRVLSISGITYAEEIVIAQTVADALGIVVRRVSRAGASEIEPCKLAPEVTT